MSHKLSKACLSGTKSQCVIKIIIIINVEPFGNQSNCGPPFHRSNYIFGPNARPQDCHFLPSTSCASVRTCLVCWCKRVSHIFIGALILFPQWLGFELFHFLKIHRHPPRSKPSHASLAASGSNHNVLELISAVGDSGTSRGIGMFPFPPCRYQLQHIVNRPSSSWYLRTAGPAPPDDVPCARFVSSSGVAHFNSATAWKGHVHTRTVGSVGVSEVLTSWKQVDGSKCLTQKLGQDLTWWVFHLDPSLTSICLVPLRPALGTLVNWVASRTTKNHHVFKRFSTKQFHWNLFQDLFHPDA